MARLFKERKAIVRFNGEEVTFRLREPNNDELSGFLSARWKTEKKELKDAAFDARCAFFDRLLTGVENLEDAEGAPVTPERKEVIPSSWKHDIIFKAFENDEIDLKN